MKIVKSAVLAALLLTLVLGVAACGGEPEAEPTSAPAATATPLPPTDTPVPPTATPEPTPSSGGDIGLEPGDLVSPSDLSSYRATMRMAISGTDNGEPVSGAIDFVIEYTSEPQAQHLVMSGEGFEGGEGTQDLEMYQVGETSYIKFGDEWLSVPTTEEMMASTGVVDPEDMLADTCGWKKQSDTQYEGIDAYHWTLSKEDMEGCMSAEDLAQIGTLTAASGDLYVAKEGNYIVSMSLAFEGTNLEAGVGTEDQVLDEGRMEVSFAMSDVNQPITIEVPAEAIEGSAMPEDIPVAEDAQELTNAFGLISYTSAVEPAELNDLYKTEMPANGWTESSAQDLSGMFILEYTKDSRTANITINTAEDTGRTSVTISITEAEG